MWNPGETGQVETARIGERSANRCSCVLLGDEVHRREEDK